MDLRILGRLLRTLADLRRHDTWTRPQLAAHQGAALTRLRQHAYAQSPFYQQFHRGLVDRPLTDLPVLTKGLLMEHFDDLVTDRAIHLADVRAYLAAGDPARPFRDRYWVNATSGSSSHPGIFLFDAPEWLMVLASFARAREWAGVRVNLTQRMKMASVASTDPWHMSAQVAATLQSWWLPTLRLAAGDPLAQIVARLNAWQPAMVIAYASMAAILAGEQCAGRLHIAPELVFTSSEVLTAAAQGRITAAWEHPPLNQYAATEAGSLAGQCVPAGNLQLNEDLLIFENVDEHQGSVPLGVDGDHLLVTVLGSRTLPLIRYELSDSVRIGPTPCPCGRPFALLTSIQGRTEDTLHLPGVAEGLVAIYPHLFHGVLDTVPAGGWRVVQEAAGRLRILVSQAAADLDDAGLTATLRRALAAQGAAATRPPDPAPIMIRSYAW